jgi:NADH-quinone oxidoreductase subunit J
MIAQITFFVLSALALGSAVLVITRKNAVHSAMWLIVTLFSVGGVFLILRAPFLFAVQIILYVGGIMVLIIFVIMLVSVDVALKQQQFSRQWPVGLATVLVLAGELGFALYHGSRGLGFVPGPAAGLPANNTEMIGTALYQNFMLPVEIASILLLVAMIGAFIMAKRRME